MFGRKTIKELQSKLDNALMEKEIAESDLKFTNIRLEAARQEIQHLKRQLSNNEVQPERERFNRVVGVMANAIQTSQAYRLTGYDFNGNPQIEPILDETSRVLGHNILEDCLKELKKMV